MRKIKDLESKEFPGVNEEKFQEWKEVQLKYLDPSNESSGYVSIEGSFTSTQEASGMFTFTDFGGFKVNGATSWTANPKK